MRNNEAVGVRWGEGRRLAREGEVGGMVKKVGEGGREEDVASHNPVFLKKLPRFTCGPLCLMANKAVHYRSSEMTSPRNNPSSWYISYLQRSFLAPCSCGRLLEREFSTDIGVRSFSLERKGESK